MGELAIYTGQLALIVAAVFTGAALYINIAEQPARLGLDDRSLLTEWKQACKRGFAMQASLAVIGFLFDLLAWSDTGHLLWLFGAAILIANWPHTLLGIMPTKRKLMGIDTIPEAERDKELPEKLKAEWPAILGWMMQRCLIWQREGLAPPGAVRAATDEYLEAEDSLGAWLGECCQSGGTFAGVSSAVNKKRHLGPARQWRTH